MVRHAAAAVILAFWMCHIVTPISCQVFDSDASEDADCLYESKEACSRADLLGCVWCTLPRRCYSASRSLELGPFCNPSAESQHFNVPGCDDIKSEDKCSSRKGCRWCRSQELDDRCFNTPEALRLPTQIFECAKNGTQIVSILRR